jgi:hypothetical protein
MPPWKLNKEQVNTILPYLFANIDLPISLAIKNCAFKLMSIIVSQNSSECSAAGCLKI